MSSVIEITNLTKKFGKVTALNQINLTVRPGEVFGFIGPNGAGKTTTIRTILGILKATAGSVKVFQKDAWYDAVKLHKKIAYVPGDVNLWSNLTGGEVIDLFVQLRGKHNAKRRAELIAKFELDPTKKCGTYSKGNRQKVALVAALASDVDLYILDEPTSGLDPLKEQIFRDEIQRLKDAGKTVFLSSHILREVELLCDRVGIIKEGKIVQVGVVSEMKKLAKSDRGLEELFMEHYSSGAKE